MSRRRRNRKSGTLGEEVRRFEAGPRAAGRSSRVSKEELAHAYERLFVLHEIDVELARFHSVERTIPKIVDRIVATLPLASVVLVELREGSPRILHWYAADVSEKARRELERRAISSLAALARETPDRLDSFERIEGPMACLTAGEAAGAVVLPLLTSGIRPLGAIQFLGTSPIGELDLAFLDAMAGQLAQTLHRFQFSERQIVRRKEAQRSRGEERFLAEATAVLLSSIDYDLVLKFVPRLVVPTLADVAWLERVVDDGRLQPIAWASVDAGQAMRMGEVLRGLPWWGMPAIRSAEFHPEVDEAWLRTEARTPAHLELLRSLRLGAVLRIPLVVEDRCVGVLTLARVREGRPFGARQRRLAEEFGRRVTQAVENSRLYSSAKRAIQTREDFVSVAAHELKSPLTALLLHVQYMHRLIGKTGQVPPLETIGAGLEETISHAQRLRTLIDQLLDLSRMRSGKIEVLAEEMDLAAAAARVAARMRSEAKEKGAAIHVAARRPVVGRWDPALMDRILTNLLSNAIKYGGGKPVDVGIEEVESRARLTVRDRGIGMSAEFLKRVFLPFERDPAVARYPGLGLGLHIVWQMVEAHGGTIRVESISGAGATFIVELPLQRPSA